MQTRPKATLVPALAGLAALAAGSAAVAAVPYRARPVRTFEYAGPPPLTMPTDVAVRADGHVFAADGVNGRVLEFDPQGQSAAVLAEVAGQELSRPLSVRIDAAGRLWIVDTGHQRVLVVEPDGRIAQTIAVPQGAAAHAPDLTDAAPAPDGRAAWLVDNDNQRLIRVELESGAQTFTGEPGESLGQFHYPFKLAVGATGDVFVTDVVNARVQMLSGAGRPVASLGSYGVDLGQLYRPKGVAIDGEGNVWVSDGVLDVIQIFAPTGTFRDVLRDEEERPLKLAMPMGLAFNAAGDLYVAELEGNRVWQFAIQVDPAAPLPVRPPPPRAVNGPAGRACTVCHLEWMEPFAGGGGTPLLEAPESTPERPYVGRPKTCLSCHDGSVVDSRRRVWAEHGHRTGVTPPPGMRVPPNLPLVEGQVACRTCHSAHTSGPPTGDISRAVFLRVPNEASELCVSCHPDKTRGPELGTHPTGGMPWPVPAQLVAAGARLGPDPRELTCQVCHTPHGSAYDHLLVMGTESNQLCLTCHAQMRPGMFREGASEHPLSPVASPAQMQAVAEIGTRLGAGNRLICLTCHKLHHGKGKRFMLADELHNGDMCLRCHAERRDLLGSPHDLRSNFPQETNRLGMTPETGGPCSACHLFHRYARAPEPGGPLDPQGQCTTCNQDGRVAEDRVLGMVNHPEAHCTQCHNPHTPGRGNFLPAQASHVCSTCHAGYLVALTGGPHDIAAARPPPAESTDQPSAASPPAAGPTTIPAVQPPSLEPPAWPVAALQAGDECLACHRPHGNLTTGLFRAGFAPSDPPDDGACLACHPAVATPQSDRTLLHPREPNAAARSAALPLVPASDDQPRLGCRTCHNPHASARATPDLLRLPEQALSEVLCVTCHTEKVTINAIGHADVLLHAVGFDADACRPCHTLHGNPQAVEPQFLWPRQLYAPEQPAGLNPVLDGYCVACHRSGGPVAPPAIATHPRADMFNPQEAGEPGYLPLFNAAGQVDRSGSIACQTCHLTHGRAAPAVVPDILGQLGLRELRARQWHIREYSPNNVCSTCHGFDGLRRFIYFHDAARRGGPIVPR